MSENQQEAKAGNLSAEQAALKRKLVARIGLAGAMIVALLGTLAFFDYLNSPEEAVGTPPAFTEPVPVAKKDVTQPVKPAEPPTEEKASVPAPAPAPAAAAQESSAAPIDKSIPPSPPAVAAQPALPRSEKTERGEKEKPSHAAPPASSARSSPPAHNVAPVAPVASGSPSRADEHRSSRESRESRESAPMAPARVEEPAPARLFSGYALQAGVFSDVRRAEELHARLTLNGIPSSLEIRVQVGPFKNRAEADAARAKMKALGVDAVLLPPKGAAR